MPRVVDETMNHDVMCASVITPRDVIEHKDDELRGRARYATMLLYAASSAKSARCERDDAAIITRYTPDAAR